MTKKATKKTTKKAANSYNNELIGKPVIVRANVAGVHCGTLTSLDLATQTCVIKDAYRLWRVYTRDSTGSISDIAANGLKKPLEQHSIGAKLNRVIIVNPQGLEIAEATDAAYATIKEASAKA